MRTTPPPQSLVLVDPQARVGIVGEQITPSIVGQRTPLVPRLVFALPTNKSAPALLEPWRFLCDNNGCPIADPDGNIIGRNAIHVHRLLTARRLNRMPISRRYSPELAPAEQSVFGMSFEYVIPQGVGIATGSLKIFNRANLTTPALLVTAGPVSVQGRTLYATVTAQGAADGQDFQLNWFATDSDGNVWPRTAFVLCAHTS